jgi:hypothetical protein
MADGAPIPVLDCVVDIDQGVRLDAEVVCFDSGPSPLFRVVTYDANDGSIISITFFDTAGAPAVPTGTPTACGDGPGATVNIIGPVGPGSCLDAVRVVQCAPIEIDSTTPINVTITGPLGPGDCADAVRVALCDDSQVQVIADPAADVRSGMVLLSGADTWTLGVDTGGGKVKSITVIRRAGGNSTSVTITDDFANVTPIISGESLTWSITALEDELTGTFIVTTTNAGDRVLVLWTEV